MVELTLENWKIDKIAVIGPGIVGMPMAAMLAHARIRIGAESPAKVVVVQRNSPTSGWKVAAINAAKSVIGGIEPDLDRIVAASVSEGLLEATHDYSQLADADVVLVCIQTDKDGLGPDYGPMFQGLTEMAKALQDKPKDKVPLIIFESTLAPSSMNSIIREHFAAFGLEEGRDILLGNSPNRVMPGRLVERVADSDKLIGGLNPLTPALIQKLYARLVTHGELHLTNSMTAEVVKTLENAYRDVRIAFAAEIVRYCDDRDIDFYQVREQVNRGLASSDDATSDPNAVPTGGLLVPTIGVGGHCLPKDGILLLWRQIESNADMEDSLILESRRINDQSPAETIRGVEKAFGELNGLQAALMGVAYRFNSEDTRNSPTLALARQLIDQGCQVIMHDPYVKPDDQKLHASNLQNCFTRDLNAALGSADVAIFCTAHGVYTQEREMVLRAAPRLKGLFDGCNLYKGSYFNLSQIGYAGIGRGTQPPAQEFIDFVLKSFRIMERGVANELKSFIDFANRRYAADEFNAIDFHEVQRIAATCVTGCDIADPGPIDEMPAYQGFIPRLVQCAFRAYAKVTHRNELGVQS
jgi:UDP-N-acetyl-D-mannosaminuronic acid dehydrogenase